MSRASKEYAEALFALAIENESEKSYNDALDLVAKVFSENPEYMNILSSPSIPLEKRLKMLDDAFLNALPTHVLSFVKLVCEKKYIMCFDEFVAEYKSLYNSMISVSDAKVISAVELTEKEKKDLEEKLEKMSGHTALLKYEIDREILGGLIIEIDGKVIDTSIKRHLMNLKDVIDK